MMSRTPCRPEDIDRLLDAQIDGSELSLLEQHLSVCELCQGRMDAKLANLSVHDAVATMLSDAADLADASAPMPQSSNLAIETLARRLLPQSENPAILGRLGEFDLIEPLGAGGMGMVFKGYDRELNRYVAIKVLSPHLSTSGAAQQRFIREAQSAAGIISPCIVPIHAVAIESSLPYLVMSYVPGKNLQEHLESSGALKPLEAIQIAQQVALGLAAAHERGIVHRDIKPANILLERNMQRAMLTDFGLARALDDVSLTQSGMLAGTPHFMSPEQAVGDPIDARSDLFSLGSVLYTMLTGHPPFRGSNAYAVTRSIAEENATPLACREPSIPNWLDHLVAKLLEKRPEDRIQSAEQVAELLEQCRMHLEHPALHPIPPELIIDERRLHPSRIRLMFANYRWQIATSVLFLGIATGIAWFAKYPESNGNLTAKFQNNPVVASVSEAMSKTEAMPSVDGTPNSEPMPATIDLSLNSEATLQESIISIDQRLRQLEIGDDFGLLQSTNVRDHLPEHVNQGENDEVEP